MVVRTMSRIGFAEARNPFGARAANGDFLEVISKLLPNIVDPVQGATGGQVTNDVQDLSIVSDHREPKNPRATQIHAHHREGCPP